MATLGGGGGGGGGPPPPNETLMYISNNETQNDKDYRAVGSKNVVVRLTVYNIERATIVSVESYKITYKQSKN